MLVRDRVPNYSLAENVRALAALTTELTSEVSLMRKHLVEVLDWISQAVFLTEEAMWHVTAYGNAGLCRTGSRPAVAVSLSGALALLWVRAQPSTTRFLNSLQVTQRATF